MFSLFNDKKSEITDLESELTKFKNLLKNSEIRYKELLDSYKELQEYAKTQSILNTTECTKLGETISKLEIELKDPRNKTAELEKRIEQLNANISILEKDKEHISKLYANSIIYKFNSYCKSYELADFIISKYNIDKDLEFDSLIINKRDTRTHIVPKHPVFSSIKLNVDIREIKFEKHKGQCIPVITYTYLHKTDTICRSSYICLTDLYDLMCRDYYDNETASTSGFIFIFNKMLQQVYDGHNSFIKDFIFNNLNAQTPGIIDVISDSFKDIPLISVEDSKNCKESIFPYKVNKKFLYLDLNKWKEIEKDRTYEFINNKIVLITLKFKNDLGYIKSIMLECEISSIADDKGIKLKIIRDVDFGKDEAIATSIKYSPNY